jgi:diphthamide biosynthesis enzyme Dph1/Dph2-like protein
VDECTPLVTGVPCLYVFVDIAFDVRHLCDCVRHNFPAGSDIALAGTIQFASAIQEVRVELGRGLHSFTSQLNLRTFGPHRSR